MPRFFQFIFPVGRSQETPGTVREWTGALSLAREPSRPISSRRPETSLLSLSHVDFSADTCVPYCFGQWALSGM